MTDDKPEGFRFHFLKSNFYRVIHADGAYGGITPRKGLMVTFYSERLPIPTVLIHDVGPDGKLGSEIGREGKDGVVREAEVSVALDLETAKALIVWLNEKVAILEGKDSSTEGEPQSGRNV